MTSHASKVAAVLAAGALLAACSSGCPGADPDTSTTSSTGDGVAGSPGPTSRTPITPPAGIEDERLLEAITEQIADLSAAEAVSLSRVDSYAAGNARLIVDARGAGDLASDRASIRVMITTDGGFTAQVGALDPGFPPVEAPSSLVGHAVVIDGAEPLAYVTFERGDGWTDRWLSVGPGSPHLGFTPEVRGPVAWRQAGLDWLRLEGTNVQGPAYDVAVPRELALDLLPTLLRALVASQDVDLQNLPPTLRGQVQDAGRSLVIDYTALLAGIAAQSEPDVAAELAGLQLQTRLSVHAEHAVDAVDIPKDETVITEPPPA